MRLDPLDLRACNELGVILFSQGRRREAVDVFRSGLAQGEDETRLGVRGQRARLMNNLGNALLESSAPKEALKAYAGSVRYDPAGPRGHYNSGVAWMRLGRPEKAVHCFEDALRLSPNFQEARVNLQFARAALSRTRSPFAGSRARR